MTLNKTKISAFGVAVILIIIFGSIFQSTVMFRSGQLYNYGVGYFGPLARDGVWHEALVGQLNNNLLPQNPGFAGVPLVNYHYFYDLGVSLIARVTGLPVRFLIYRFLPIVFSLLLGFGTYLLVSRIFKNKTATLASLYLIYFGSSFGWVIDVLKSREIGGESAFWANQPVSMNLNPPFAISLVMMVFIILLINKFLVKPTNLTAIAITGLSGILIGFKVYAGLIILGGIFFLAVKKILVDKSYSMLLIFIFSFLISIMIFLITGSFGSAGFLIFQPLWLVDTMIDAGDRVGIPNFTSRRFTYLAAHKWLHLGLVEIVSLFIFVAGNMGTRIVSAFSGGWRFFTKDINFLILVMTLISFAPPLVFIQKGNPWNIIQFFYYFLFLTALLAGVSLSNISKWLPKKVVIFIFIVFIVLTPISSFAAFRGWLYPTPPAYVSNEEVGALEFLSQQDPGVVLKHPYDPNLRSNYKSPFPIFSYADSAYVSAYSGKPVYLEDVEQQIILGTDYENRLTSSSRFFMEKDLSWSNQFLKDNSIKYLYLPKVYPLPMAEEEYQMAKIFENSEVNIYKIIN